MRQRRTDVIGLCAKPLLFYIFSIMKKLSFILAFSAVAAFAGGNPRFAPEVYKFENVKQGDVKHVVLKALNTGDDMVLETVMSQGTGAANFKYPTEIAKGKAFKIEFDLNTEYMEGPVQENIILVEKGGKPFVARVEGVVTPELMFSEKLLDAGFYKAGSKKSWSFYVWSPDGKTVPQLKLRDDAKEFKAEFKSVKLNVDKIDEIKEGGKVPGVKVTLSTNGISREGMNPNQKSIRRIVGFESASNKKAKCEVLIVGYWE